MTQLLEGGADPNARLSRKTWFTQYNFDLLRIDDGGATPFWRAAYASDIAAMTLLLACGADINAKESKYGQTPLQLAVAGSHTDVAELLRGRHAMLSAPPRVENQEAIAASSPDPDDGMDDFGDELKRWRNQAIIFGVPALIVLGGLVWVVVKFFMGK